MSPEPVVTALPCDDACVHGIADETHMVHRHRDVQGGTARAAVFGVSDGLVSNVALILGIAGASTDGSLVQLAGVSGLLAGAISMAAGEWVMCAQNELIERELEIEQRSLAENPEAETRELAAIYEARGLDAEQAEQVAAGVVAGPAVALDVHAREARCRPRRVGSPLLVAVSSFVAFAVAGSASAWFSPMAVRPRWLRLGLAWAPLHSSGGW